MPIIQHVPQNNTWTLILDQTILKSHKCDLKRRHFLQDLSLCKLFSNPVITHVSTHDFDTYLTRFKGFSEGDDVHDLPFPLQKNIWFSLCSL